MHTMPTKQTIFPVLPQYEHLDVNELVNRLDHDSPQVRASALAALGNKAGEQSLGTMIKAIKEERNRKAPWFGFITVSWVGVVSLLQSGDGQAQKLAREIVSEWDPDEKQHLISWLKDFPAYAQALTS